MLSMASSAVPANPSAHNVASILSKLRDADPDIRYMTLNDLHQMLQNGHPTFLSHDYTTCARTIEGLLETLNDQNGDVQNMSVKCLGPFVNKAPESILCPLFDKISNLRTDNTVDSSITALAVRAVVVALPRPVQGAQRNQKVQEAYSAVSRALIPRLVGYIVMPQSSKNLPAPPKGMLEVEIENGQDSNALDVLTEVARCFGAMLKEPELQALQKITVQILESSRCGSVMKKKAVTALSLLAVYFTDALLSSFISYTIEVLRQSTLVPSQRKLYLTIYGSMARSIPKTFGPYLKTLAPFIIAPLSQDELDSQLEEAAESDEALDPQMEEVREAALMALDSCEALCKQDMQLYRKETVESALRFLKYDPNYANDDDDMDVGDEEEELDFDQDDDFEEETGFDDEDDSSWKVRRCAAKLLHTLAADRNLMEDGTLYGVIGPALINRFTEREDSVRLQVFATLASLIKMTDESTPKSRLRKETSNGTAPSSRKRRRGSSSAGTTDMDLQVTNGYASPGTPPPQTNAQESLRRISPDIINGTAKLLKTSTQSTKQAAVALLTQLVTTQHGGLSEGIDLVIPPVISAMQSTTSASSSSVATQHTFRIEALQFLRVLAETHSSKVLQPHISQIVSCLVAVAQDKYSKVAAEAFETIEIYVKALTPPRSAASQQDNARSLQNLYDVITRRIAASDTDTDVRTKAIQALGLLLGRTSGSTGSSLISQDSRFAGLDILSERLRNELTRLASVRAVDTVAVLAQSKKEFHPEWVRSVSLELAAQFRKASRSLRGASLSALRMLAINAATRDNYDDKTVQQLVKMLLPLINESDLHMLSPALIIIGAFAKDRPRIVLQPEVISGFCFVTKMDIHGAALDALLSTVETIGSQGHGKDLMGALLKEVGISGNPEIVGQVIGTLVVSGGSGLGVTLDDFKKELSGEVDDKRKCLALYILGEAGLRLGSTSGLTPHDFNAYFDVGSDKLHLAAAVSLGRAGAGDVATFLPQILNAMDSGRKYLYLHSIKEMLQHSTAEGDILEHSKQLWENIVTASQAEDNKTVGAECIGRLAMIDPTAYLPQLQVRYEATSSSSKSLTMFAGLPRRLSACCPRHGHLCITLHIL